MAERQSNHLHRVIINGFKSIKHLDLAIKPINILLGANGAGKSNFISLKSELRHRLVPYIQMYEFDRKTTHGPNIANAIGLTKLRENVCRI